MKINWKVRAKNPYFWIGLIGVILTAMGVSPEMFVSWSIVKEQIIGVFSNPFLLSSIIIAIIGYIPDYTTKGFSDSDRAMGYAKPYSDKVPERSPAG